MLLNKSIVSKALKTVPEKHNIIPGEDHRVIPDIVYSSGIKISELHKKEPPPRRRLFRIYYKVRFNLPIFLLHLQSIF
jgi:hypothetical protein